MPRILVAVLVGLARLPTGQPVDHRVSAPGPGPSSAANDAVAGLGVPGLVWTTTGIRPRQWVAVHRKHHAFTDVAGRPALPGPARLSQGPVDQSRTCTARWPRTTPPWPASPGTCRPTAGTACCSTRPSSASASASRSSVSCSAGSLGLLVAGVHAVTYLLLSGAVNAFGHNWGRRPYDGPRHQQPVAGLARRRRGPPQQPSRRADVGPAVPAQG